MVPYSFISMSWFDGINNGAIFVFAWSTSILTFPFFKYILSSNHPCSSRNNFSPSCTYHWSIFRSACLTIFSPHKHRVETAETLFPDEQPDPHSHPHTHWVTYPPPREAQLRYSCAGAFRWGDICAESTWLRRTKTCALNTLPTRFDTLVKLAAAPVTKILNEKWSIIVWVKLGHPDLTQKRWLHRWVKAIKEDGDRSYDCQRAYRFKRIHGFYSITPSSRPRNLAARGVGWDWSSSVSNCFFRQPSCLKMEKHGWTRSLCYSWLVSSCRSEHDRTIGWRQQRGR